MTHASDAGTAPATSSEAALGLLTDLETWLATDVTRSVDELRARLVRRLREQQASQPWRALVHQLCARVLDTADAALARRDTPVDARAALAAACAAEREDMIAARTAVARTAGALLDEREAWIATLSRSLTVLESFLLAQRAGRAPRALMAESRPHLEGRAAAAALAGAGIPVWLVVDAALPLVASQARMAWLGADAVTDRGVLCKVGGFALALAAREHSVPVYALASRRKFLPAATGALRITEMPAGEVWDAAPAGVRPRNVTLELMPLELVRGFVVEDEVLGPSEAAQLARDRELPGELRGG